MFNEKGVFLDVLDRATELSNGSYSPGNKLVVPAYLGNQEFTLEEYLWLSKDSIIFSHEFCKVFFGEEWEKHIQEMAKSEDRIEYLSIFLENSTDDYKDNTTSDTGISIFS